MSRDRYERRHRRTAKHPECIAIMANANFNGPTLSEAMGLEDEIVSDPGFLADVMSTGPEEAKQLLRRLGMYTHIGWRSNVGERYRSSRLYGHDTPKPGKTHALTCERHPQLGDRWRGLCGEIVHDNGGKDDYGDAIAPNVRPAPDENGQGVTCKRCRRIVSRQ